MSEKKKINIEDENLENTSAENEEVKNEEQTSECSADDVKEEDAVDPLEAAQEENTLASIAIPARAETILSFFIFNSL